MNDFVSSISPFVLSNIVEPLTVAVFTVIGGAIPIAILIYLFSRKEKNRLLAHAKEIENALPIQEKLFEKMTDLVNGQINSRNLSESLDRFKQLIEGKNMIEENKKFIKYAKNYDFISAIGHVLRAGNYMPRGINEHREISKNLPHSSSSDT